jgi:Family of unknown function (DUF6502)
VAQSVKHNLLAAFRYLFRPLVRVAVKNGATFPEVAEMLRDAFVHVASAEVAASGKKPTANAVAAMVGIGAEQAEFHLSSPRDAELGSAAQNLSLAARVLVGWHTDREYIGPYGLVQDLPFVQPEHGTRVEGLSFVELAERHCPEVPPRDLLDELLRAGSVQEVGNGFFRATSRSYVPEQLSPESIRRFAQVIHNVCETLEVNLRKSGQGSGRIERTIFADYGLTEIQLKEFNNYIRERGQAFADDIDNWLARRSKKSDEKKIQTGIGFYHYVVNEPDELDLGQALREVVK